MNNNQYIFSKEAFKRIKLEKKENDFCDELKNYYFPSKYHYLERDKTYKNFVTIIRQICKYHHIPFTYLISNILNQNMKLSILFTKTYNKIFTA